MIRATQTILKMQNQPVTGIVFRASILLAIVNCDVQISGITLSVPCENWNKFTVSDAGMNYHQVLQVNCKDDIQKINEDENIKDNCWVLFQRRNITTG